MATKYWISTGTSSSAVTFNTGANWLGGTAPSSGDTVVFGAAGTADVLTNTATGLASLTVIVQASYAGRIGSINAATATYLQAGDITSIIGQSTGGTTTTSFAGPSLVMLNGTNSHTATVITTAQNPSVSSYAAVLLSGPAITLNQTGGLVGIATTPASTATLTVGTVAKGSSSVAPVLDIGSGATVTTLNAAAGTVRSIADQTCTTTNLSGSASYTSQGSGAHTTLTVGTGTRCNYWGSGNIATLNATGTFDRTADARSITISTLNVYPGSTLLLNNGRAGSITRSAVNLLQVGHGGFNLTTPTGENL